MCNTSCAKSAPWIVAGDHKQLTQRLDCGVRCVVSVGSRGMSKAEFRLSETKTDTSRPANARTDLAADDAYKVRARRSGFFLMVLSGLVMLGLLTAAWWLLARTL